MGGRLSHYPPVKIGFYDLTGGFSHLRGACCGQIFVYAGEEGTELGDEKGVGSLLPVFLKGAVALVVAKRALDTCYCVSSSLQGL